MISKNIVQFLKELNKNNYKEWFQENKDFYLKAKQEFEFAVNLLINEIGKFDRDISGLQAKDCIFRIYRDVRFSKDKNPYKTNFGAYMAKGGRKSGFAGYYIHVEPTGNFLAGGIYMPMPPVLKALRTDIYNNIDEFKDIINNKNFKKFFGTITGSRLATAPKGFPKEFPDIDLLKFKDYNMIKEISDNMITGNDFMNQAIEVFKAMKPLNDFLNHAVENAI